MTALTGRAEWTGRYLPNASVVNPAKGFVTGWNNKASPDTRNPDGENLTNVPYHQFGMDLTLGDETLIGDYEDLKRSALDPYIAVRDAYFQYRKNKIKE